MKKKPERKDPDLGLAFKGLIPWSTKEFYLVFAKYQESKQRSQKKISQLLGRNDNNLLLLSEVFHKKYPDELEFTAHFYRFGLMRMFIFKYGKKLIKEGFSAKEGEAGFRPELMDILCTLPYSQEIEESGDKFHTFSYKEVEDATWSKINAYLN